MGTNDRDAERTQRLDELFASFSADIVGYCTWRAATRSDAQDATAEVFLTAWRRLDDVPEGDAARVWLYATARRVIANQRRSHRRRAALQERLTHEAAPSRPRSTGRRPSCAKRSVRFPSGTARCSCWPNGRGSHRQRSRAFSGA
jgi:RNA polymerase sigma-70 factor (ECF subfamily)